MQLMKMGGFLKSHYVHIQHAETKLHSPHKTSNHRHETRKQHIIAFIAETHFKSVRHDTHTHTHCWSCQDNTVCFHVHFTSEVVTVCYRSHMSD